MEDVAHRRFTLRGKRAITMPPTYRFLNALVLASAACVTVATSSHSNAVLEPFPNGRRLLAWNQ